MQLIAQHLNRVREQIREHERRYGRGENSVRLLAVSKTRSAAAIREAVTAGQHDFGENYQQEALPKMEALADAGVRWHFIGPVQSNKTRGIAARFAWLHSLERGKIARRLSDQRPPDLPPLNICIQVNVSGESSKSGAPPDRLMALATEIDGLPRLKLRGLMCLPAPTDDFGEQRRAFAALRRLLDELRAEGHTADTLSMGTTGDMEAAIAEGATIVRIGTAIFGPRQ